jgi:hypothetical protein
MRWHLRRLARRAGHARTALKEEEEEAEQLETVQPLKLAVEENSKYARLLAASAAGQGVRSSQCQLRAATLCVDA